jgi:hypothetical protein
VTCTRLSTCFAVAALLSLGPCVSRASAQEARPPSTTPAQEEAEHQNELAAVVAATKEHEGETFFTLGVEYERRLTPKLGVGGEIEYLFDADRWIVVVPLVLHPGYGLKIFGGPGFERSQVEGTETEPDLDERESNFLLRIGAGYVLEFAERYSVTPTVSVDFIREPDEWNHAFVYGVSVGVAF